MSRDRVFTLVWCFVNILMLLSFATPFAIITINLVMVPALVLFAKLNLKQAVLSYAISLVVVIALARGIGVVVSVIAVFFLPPAIIIARFYKSKMSARFTIIAGTATLLAQFLLALLLGFAMGLEPMARLRQFLHDSVESLPEIFRSSLNQEAFNMAIHYFMQIIPMLLVIMALIYIFVGHTIARWILRKNGMQVPGLSPIRKWMLPKSMAFYLLIAMISDMFIGIESSSFYAMVVWNLLPLLSIAFTVQAIGFLFFVSYTKGWPPALPIISIVIVVLLPFLAYFYCIMGVLDVLLPLRKRIA